VYIPRNTRNHLFTSDEGVLELFSNGEKNAKCRSGVFDLGIGQLEFDDRQLGQIEFDCS
jgi:hypothetical protein